MQSRKTSSTPNFLRDTLFQNRSVSVRLESLSRNKATLLIELFRLRCAQVFVPKQQTTLTYSLLHEQTTSSINFYYKKGFFFFLLPFFFSSSFFSSPPPPLTFIFIYYHNIIILKIFLLLFVVFNT